MAVVNFERYPTAAGTMAAPAAQISLKTQAQRELHLSSRICADGLPECRIGLLPSGVEPRGGVDRIKLVDVERNALGSRSGTLSCFKDKRRSLLSPQLARSGSLSNSLPL
jgi:hypothetical protein